MLILHRLTAFLIWVFGAEASREAIALAIEGWVWQDWIRNKSEFGTWSSDYSLRVGVSLLVRVKLRNGVQRRFNLKEVMDVQAVVVTEV